MRSEIRWNRERDSAIRRCVTAVATLRWPRVTLVVLRVVELHVEAFVETRGKILQWRISALGIGVTDETHRNRRRRELSAMTIRAGLVTGETRRGGVVSAFVTGSAGNGTVSLARVQKLGVIELGTLCCRHCAEAQCDDGYTDDANAFTHLMSLRLSGGRSAIATALLQRHGFNAVNVAGGFGAWQAAGAPVIRSEAAMTPHG